MPSILPSAQHTFVLMPGLQTCQASPTGQVCYQLPGCQLLVGFMQLQGHQTSTHIKAVCSAEETHQACANQQQPCPRCPFTNKWETIVVWRRLCKLHAKLCEPTWEGVLRSDAD